MAEGRTSEREARETLRNYRIVVANAVGFLRSQETNRSFAAYTLEEAVDQQIERIEGTGAGTADLRPNRLVQLDRIKQELDSAIQGIKDSDPDLFASPDPTQDVNTEPEPEDS